MFVADDDAEADGGAQEELELMNAFGRLSSEIARPLRPRERSSRGVRGVLGFLVWISSANLDDPRVRT